MANWTAPSSKTGSVQYLYDNEGHRVLQRSNTTNGSSTTVNDTIPFDGYTDTTINNGTTTTTKYYHAAGQEVAEGIGTTWYYLIPDLLGSATLALKSDGSVQSAQLYAPYGSSRYSDGSMPTAYNFTGQRFDICSKWGQCSSHSAGKPQARWPGKRWFHTDHSRSGRRVPVGADAGTPDTPPAL